MNYNYMNPDRGFGLKSETEDYILLKQFNRFLNIQHLVQISGNEYADASGYTTDGRVVNVEIKKRNQTYNNLSIEGTTKQGHPYTADTLYIESHKACDLLLDYLTSQKEPLYVNFLSNNVVVVYNLAKLKHRPKRTLKKIWSDLYQGFELGKRQELRLEDAYIYKLENNHYTLIHKP